MRNSYLQTDLSSEFDRLQQQVASLFGGLPSSLRSDRYGSFPKLNVGTTDDAIEIVAFVPGVKSDQLDVSIDKGLLTISGQREASFTKEDGDDARRYAQERYAGSFRRTIELPPNANPDQVTARCINGCLMVTIAKHEASKPRAITVQ